MKEHSLHQYIPLDSHLQFHKICACTALFFSILHTIGTWQHLNVQGDHSGLRLHFVDFDMVCSSVWKILLGQVKIWQCWHDKLTNGQNSQIGVNTILSQTTRVTLYLQTISDFAHVLFPFRIAGHLVNFYHVGTQPIEHLHCLSRELNFPSDGKPTISYWLFQVLLLIIIIKYYY